MKRLGIPIIRNQMGFGRSVGGATMRLFGYVRKAAQWVRLIFTAALHARRAPPEVLATSMDLVDANMSRFFSGQKLGLCSRFMRKRPKLIVGWGRKLSGQQAVSIAKRLGVPFTLLEDGFLRSVDRFEATQSIVMDPIGIYYDATVPSHLEQLIAAPLTADEIARTQGIVDMWRRCRVSKYNALPEYKGPSLGRYVLVIDQTFGDASVAYGRADATCFDRMLDAAIKENPGCQIVVKTHPDTKSGTKNGYFHAAQVGALPRVQIVSDACHPVGLIEHAEAVYTVTSQVGFEALIWGKRVRTFGMPFYAGWGLTEDDLPVPDRRVPVSKDQLFHAALVKYARYYDPVTGQPCEVERTIENIGFQRAQRLRFPGLVDAVGFSLWKRAFIRKFLTGSVVHFSKRNRVGSPAAAIAVWGSRDLNTPLPVLRVEDGFIRSSGLGADLVYPVSLVVDDVGIYYDSTRPSGLEVILNTQVLSPAALRRAAQLRMQIVDLNITKYNLGGNTWTRPDNGKPIILVVGQVEADASIKFGSPAVKENISLLRAVRDENPDAYILYKPHPDVVAGLRKKGQGEDESKMYCDEIIAANIATDQLLGQVDAVHTMTSLLGFEALMRGVCVTCHGLPFYAGWGLTDDKISCARRTKTQSLDALVHAALIAYPRYFNFDNNCFMTPEQAVYVLANSAKSGPTTGLWYRKLLRYILVISQRLKEVTS